MPVHQEQGGVFFLSCNVIYLDKRITIQITDVWGFKFATIQGQIWQDQYWIIHLVFPIGDLCNLEICIKVIADICSHGNLASMVDCVYDANHIIVEYSCI